MIRKGSAAIAALVAGSLVAATATSVASPFDVGVFDALKAMEALPSDAFGAKFEAEFAQKEISVDGTVEDFRRGTVCRLYLGVWTAKGEAYFCPMGEEIRPLLQFRPGDRVHVTATIIAWNGVDNSLHVGDLKLAPAAPDASAEAPPSIAPSSAEQSFPNRAGRAFDSRALDDMRDVSERKSSEDFSAYFDERYTGKNFADTGAFADLRSGVTCSVYVAIKTAHGEAWFCPQADEVRAIGAFRRGETVRVRGHIASFSTYDDSLFLVDAHLAPP